MTGLSEEQAEALHAWSRVENQTVWLEADTVEAAVERLITEAVAAERAAIREALGGEVAVEAGARESFYIWTEGDEEWDEFPKSHAMYRDAARAALRAALDSLGSANCRSDDGGGNPGGGG